MSVKSLYGISVGKKPVVPTNHFYDKHNPPQNMETQFWFWCANDDREGVILIDQGCGQSVVDDMKVPFKMKRQPVELLERIGIKPEDVKHVILSHLHWDHFAGDYLYPNAIYYAHEREMRHLMSNLMRFKIYNQHYYLPVAKKILDLLYSGKLVVITDDNFKLGNSVEAIRMGGHTPGLMSVKITGNSGDYVVCSDVAPRYQNLEEQIPCGIHYNVTEALEAQEKIMKLAHNLEHVLPGHDPLIMEKFPVIEEGIVRVF